VRVAGQSPTSCDRRSNSPLHHPGICHCHLGLFLTTDVAAFNLTERNSAQSCGGSSSRLGEKYLCTSPSRLFFAAGTIGPGISIALPFELQRISSPAGFEPATAGAM